MFEDDFLHTEKHIKILFLKFIYIIHIMHAKFWLFDHELNSPVNNFFFFSIKCSLFLQHLQIFSCRRIYVLIWCESSRKKLHFWCFRSFVNSNTLRDSKYFFTFTKTRSWDIWLEERPHFIGLIFFFNF